MNKDIQNLQSQYNKYIYPKPVENIDLEFIKKGKALFSDPNFSWHRLWPEKAYSRKKLKVLVAGCGSDQAAILSKCNPNHYFTGIDLSQQSINYQKKLQKKHNIENLDLICNDFRNIHFDKKFDYIISTGVIHHLEDPGSALDYFNNNLEDDGVVYLMVYGDKQSSSLLHIKKIFETLDLKQDQQSIDIAKETILRLHSQHPAKIFAQSSFDFNHSAGIVDFLLHKKEKFFQINELVKLLAHHNLVIKNFFNGKVASVTKYFLNNPKYINLIRNLKPEKQWELGQILNWDDRKIEFVICKDKNINHSIVYNPIKIENAFLYGNMGIDYKTSNENILITENDSKISLKFNTPKGIVIDWKSILEGKIILSKVFDKLEKESLFFLRNLLQIMIENYFVDVSYKKIEDYQKYLGK